MSPPSPTTSSFLRCSWNVMNSVVDICMFGGKCDLTTQQCSCPDPTTIKDNIALHIEGCIPQAVLDLYWLHVVIYIICLMRTLYIIKIRNLKRYIYKAAIAGVCICVIGIILAICAIYEGGSFIGWSLGITIQGAIGGYLFVQLWLAIVFPLFRTTGRGISSHHIEHTGNVISSIGFIIQGSIGLAMAITSVQSREAFNIALLAGMVLGAGHLALVIFGIGIHASELAKVINDDNAKRESLGVRQNVDLSDVEKRVKQVERLAKPAAIQNFAVGLIPTILYASSGTAPLIWLFPIISSVAVVTSACFMVDTISSKTTRDYSAVPTSPTSPTVVVDGGGGKVRISSSNQLVGTSQ
jgi:hypothetical protein